MKKHEELLNRGGGNLSREHGCQEGKRTGRIHACHYEANEVCHSNLINIVSAIRRRCIGRSALLCRQKTLSRGSNTHIRSLRTTTSHKERGDIAPSPNLGWGEVKKYAFTLAEVFSPLCAGCCKIAFTLAEVLITLAIIGVVAAMTMPMLIANYQKDVTVNKLKKAYSTINQAIRLAEVDHSEYVNWDKSNEIGAEAYFGKYFKPYLNEPYICLTPFECGYSKAIPYIYRNGERCGSSISMSASDDSRVTFYLHDGTFFLIFTTGDTNAVENNSVFIDINGGKSPNIIGKDVFMFHRIKKGILPYGYNLSDVTIDQNCSINGTGEYCAAKILKDGWRITSNYPW